MIKKKRLFWHIFPSFLVIVVLSLSAVTFFSTRYFRGFFLENSEKELTIRAKLLQRQFTCLLGGDLEKFHDVNQSCREIGENTGTRVTVILPSGVVVGDSQGAVMEMENHLGRPEIMEALKRKKGVSIRYSSTLDQDMMYIALPVIHDGGVIAVVRTSVSVSAIDNEIKSVGHNVLIAFFLTILAAAVISLYTTRRITRPVEEMRKGAAEFARGNLNARLVVPDSEELSKLAVTMNRMAENLDEKIKAVNSRSMELEAVHSSMEEGVIAVDGNEKIITMNDAAAAAFGFSPSELKTGNILELSRNLELQSFFQRAMGTHDPVEDDITISGEGGDDLILNIHSTALYDAGGRRMGTLIIFHDITRIRRLEQMHKDFAANVSHELRTPLTTIKGFIETLQTMTAHNGVAETERFLKIIEKNVTRMIELIRDLLALAKLERLQGLDISFDRHNVAPLIQGAVHTCHPAIREKNITVTIDCPRDLSAAVDPVLIEQAVINLVDNAVKYSTSDQSVGIKVKEDRGGINITIEDQGCGMGREHLSKIFNRFYRVDRARSREEGGTGLGLAIVKHIVQYHHGTIHVRSIKDRGTAFTITIPEK